MVIVVDLGNYKPEAREEVPFKAGVIREYDHEVIVKSLVTGKEYEVYYSQLLEYCTMKEIRNMVDLHNYGEFANDYIEGYRGDI